MADSEKYIWVCVNRDKTPRITGRFAVTAHPSILFLGRADENVHRFSGFREPKRFLESMAEGLERYRLYRAGAKYDTLKPRLATICSEAKVTKLFAPSKGLPAGLTFFGDDLVVGQRVYSPGARSKPARLFRVDAKKGTVLSGVTTDSRVRDICSDGRVLYAVQSGWTKGDPILVLDPKDGRVRQEIVTAANEKNRSSGASGITFYAGKLLVQTLLKGMYAVEIATGNILWHKRNKTRYVSGLAFDGKYLVTASRDTLYLLDPSTTEVTRSVPIHYPVRSLTARDGVYYLLEQPVWGFDRDHTRVQIWPRDVWIHRLSLKE